MYKLVINQEDVLAFDNLYRISKENFEKYDVVEVNDVIHKTKFYKLLLKEWFDCIKVGGYLEISILNENNILNNWGIRQIVFGLLNEYVEYSALERGGSTVHRVKKLKSTKLHGDEITKWSFGIVTNGRRSENVRKLIDSIVIQSIPEFEIIICGKIDLECIADYKKVDIKYIEFSQRDELGWITKKKNLICDSSKYNNIALFHDRFTLDVGWYVGMNKYGNNYEVLSCCNVSFSNKRSEDWSFYKGSKLDMYLSLSNRVRTHRLNFPVLLEYRDWNEGVFIPGGGIIIKKNIWKKCAWDERLHWMEEEDVQLTHNQVFKGIIPRFNPFSIVWSFESRGNQKYIIVFNRFKLGRINYFIRYSLSKLKRAWSLL